MLRANHQAISMFLRRNATQGESRSEVLSISRVKGIYTVAKIGES
jgi:hypothetical protein